MHGATSWPRAAGSPPGARSIRARSHDASLLSDGRATAAVDALARRRFSHVAAAPLGWRLSRRSRTYAPPDRDPADQALHLSGGQPRPVLHPRLVGALGGHEPALRRAQAI